MSSKKTASSKSNGREEQEHHENSHFSRAVMEVAENNLREFEARLDESFLIRAEFDRRVNSL